MLTKEQILAMPAGPDLDGLVDDLVFHVDRTAGTPEKISAAIRGWIPKEDISNDERHAYAFDLGGQRYEAAWDRRDKGPFPATWLWAQRDGKPYQAALEAFVSAFRFPARAKYSEDIGPAWDVLAAVGGRLFSVRNRFARELALLCVLPSGSRVAWPDAMLVFHAEMPRFISQAAILASLEQTP